MYQQVNWSAKEITKQTDSVLRQVGKALDGIAAAAPSKRASLDALAALENELYAVQPFCEFAQHVSPDAERREASEAAAKRFADFEVDFGMRADVYGKLKAFAESAEGAALEGEEARYLQRVLMDFERNGLALPEAEREELRTKKKRIAELCVEMNTCNNGDISFILVQKAELAGMSDAFIDGLESDEDGALKLTTKYPHVFPVMEQCSVEGTRQRLEFAFANRAPENAARFRELLQLRHQVAALLGYASFADYVLEPRMAKNAAAVQRMYDDLLPKLRLKGAAEREALLSMSGASTLDNWSVLYWQNQRLKRDFAVDSERVKQYFVMARVVRETLAIYQQLLGLRFERLDEGVCAVWHPEVEAYSVRDAESGRLYGYFYLDLYPRDHKFSHAAAFPLQVGLLAQAQGGAHLAVEAMVCNFPKPSAAQPSLLSHKDFETFFHEFGHVVHGVIGHAQHARFSGTNVERDFVECPSQAMENWCWERAVLQRIGRHHATEEPLPDALIDAMLAARNANAGLFQLRQAFLGLVDQRMHTQPDADPHALYAQMREEVSLVRHTPDTQPLCSWMHMFGGYEASYYGYIWSNRFAADVYARFAGPFDRATGALYRRQVLERGGAEDAEAYLRSFLGREPNSEAFLRQIGLE